MMQVKRYNPFTAPTRMSMIPNQQQLSKEVYILMPLESFVQLEFDALIARIEKNDSTLTFVNLSRGFDGHTENGGIYSMSDWMKCSLDGNDLLRLSEALKKNTVVTGISLAEQFDRIMYDLYSFQSSKGIDDATIRANIGQLLPTLIQHPTLTQIDLSRNRLKKSSAMLAAEFAKATTPKQLNLQDNRITEINYWLTHFNPHVQVDFTNNPLDIDSIIRFVEFQRAQQGNQLKQLNLQQFSLSEQNWMNVLQYCAQYGHEIIELNLTGPYMPRAFEVSKKNYFSALFSFLQTTPQLQTLNLAHNQLTSNEVTPLLDIINMYNRSLIKLNLDSNKIDATGGEKIAYFLYSNETLQTLNVRGNLLTDIGVNAILGALATNSTLTVLDMERCMPYDKEKFSPPALLLPHTFKAVQRLDLSNNNITVVLNQHSPSSLKHLNLSDNQITLAQATELVIYAKKIGFTVQLYSYQFTLEELLAHCNAETSLQIPKSFVLRSWQINKDVWKKQRHKNARELNDNTEQMESDSDSDNEEKVAKRHCKMQQ